MRHRTAVRRHLDVALTVALAGVAFLTPSAVRAALDEDGFRAVAVALARHPVSAIAVAPDGRLFAAVQAIEQTDDEESGTAEIRVYASYATNDGSVLDEGTLWATVDGIRATNNEEGLLGMALAPDFATSKLVYVYMTTPDEEVNQHVRVYRENASGTGDYVGIVKTTLEPENENAGRNGGPLTFGVDGCLYLGIGDNGGNNRWMSQLLVDTNPIEFQEPGDLCTDVCLGTTQYPQRDIDDPDGLPNHAGKVLRMAVEGAANAQPGPGAPLPANPFVFGTGVRNPGGLYSHPLTGQLYVADRADGVSAELSIVDSGSNLGWPCLEGSSINTGAASCLSASTPAAVYANHPDWRRPLVAHPGNGLVMTGMTAYTGLGYPEQYYGDVFYLLRDSARIERIDLQPPCFVPSGTELTPLPFHDSTNDNDFRAIYDIDDDEDFDNVGLGTLVDMTQGPDAMGRQVLYVAGKQNNGNDFTADTAIYRIEFATTFVPYSGPTGRVADACFGSGPNPFQRATCLPPGGPCPGQPDGSSCEDGDPCNGAEICSAGICQHSAVPAPDGTSCTAGGGCTNPGVCQSGECAAGPPLPDGTPCPDADACNGLETCVSGACQAGTGPAPLDLRALTVKGKGILALTGAFQSALAVAPSSTDTVSLQLQNGGTTVFQSDLTHPGSDGFWKKAKRGAFKYKDGRGSAGGLTSFQLQPGGGGLAMKAKAKASGLAGVEATTLDARLMIGPQCFTATVSCGRKGKTLRCGP
ncbi:MAG TPA: PQQ-dependent sugar dehydrogenase [Candidatus Binatia bacterium]|jgi:glucose/arabinose dehydrogenase|nr:PQQ-dependent sugar dehydrogenase [Candidatus Binatia bacterium]